MTRRDKEINVSRSTFRLKTYLPIGNEGCIPSRGATNWSGKESKINRREQSGSTDKDRETSEASLSRKSEGGRKIECRREERKEKREKKKERIASNAKHKTYLFSIRHRDGCCVRLALTVAGR